MHAGITSLQIRDTGFRDVDLEVAARIRVMTLPRLASKLEVICFLNGIKQRRGLDWEMMFDLLVFSVDLQPGDRVSLWCRTEADPPGLR
jgi:hypothetical protein